MRLWLATLVAVLSTACVGGDVGDPVDMHQGYGGELQGFADAQGLAVYYERYGQGRPLILVHGWGANAHSNWIASGWIQSLVEHRAVVVLDVRGHGRSDKPYALEPYSYAAMSEDVLAVMDALHIEQADYMGYSMGAFMGAYLLGHHPQRFTSMVLGGIGDETSASAAQGLAIAEALRAPDDAQLEPGYARQVRKFVSADAGNDLTALAYSAEKMWPEGYPLKIAGDQISQATLPVLIVNGSNDLPYVETADALAAALPDARHVRIPGHDHLSVVAAPQFKQLVVEFLTGLE